MAFKAPYLGHGIGLRPTHYQSLLESAPGTVDWCEVISENFMDPRGEAVQILEQVRARMPVVLHGVSLSIGSSSPLNTAYLHDLQELAARIQPAWISDHLCWSGANGRYTHQLLPLPYTEECLAHVAERVMRVQEALGRPLMLENVSSYVLWKSSTMTEWEFMAALAQRTGCGLLLDVTNVYVDAFNHDFAAQTFLDAMPAGQVGQIHLAGHEEHDTHYFDTHDRPVAEPVWDLYRKAVQMFGRTSTLVEWDEDIASFEELAAQVHRARCVEAYALATRGDALPETEIEVRASQPASPSLIVSQEIFLDYTCQPDPAALPESLVRQFVQPKRGSVEQFLTLYNDMYWTRVMRELRENYPLTRRWLGRAQFEAWAHAYMHERPSGHHDVMRVGVHFAQWLTSRDFAASQIATVEWGAVSVLRRPVQQAASFDTIHTLTPELARAQRLQFVEPFLWVDLECDVDDILRGLIAEEAVCQLAEPKPHPGALALWYTGEMVERAALQPAEKAALEHVRSGASFAQLCALLTEQAAQGGEAPARVLRRWFQRGWVAGFVART